MEDSYSQIFGRFMEDSYSQISGLGKPENHDEFVAIKSFFLYQNKYLKDADAFILPLWFIEARKKFTRDEVQQMYNDIKRG